MESPAHLRSVEEVWDTGMEEAQLRCVLVHELLSGLGQMFFIDRSP